MAALSSGAERQRCFSCAQMPTKPLGEKITKQTKIRPNQSSQSAVQIEKSSRNRIKNKARETEKKERAQVPGRESRAPRRSRPWPAIRRRRGPIPLPPKRGKSE